jgi:hypothetical protein
VGVEVGDGHVEGVVDAGFAGGFGAPDLKRFGEGMAAGLEGEVDDRGGASDGGGAGAGEVVVRGGGAAEGHVEVGVDVDASGENEEVPSVYDLVAFGGDVRGDLGDDLALNENVSAFFAVRVDDDSLLDKCAHKCL